LRVEATKLAYDNRTMKKKAVVKADAKAFELLRKEFKKRIKDGRIDKTAIYETVKAVFAIKHIKEDFSFEIERTHITKPQAINLFESLFYFEKKRGVYDHILDILEKPVIVTFGENLNPNSLRKLLENNDLHI